MYTWSKTFLPNYILNVLGDRMEMAHSVEGRVPFLDHRVVEVARRLPISMKIHDMTEKYVLREATRPVLSDTVYRRQKHPFLAPPATLNPNGRMHQLINDTLRGSRLAHAFFSAIVRAECGKAARDTATAGGHDCRGRRIAGFHDRTRARMHRGCAESCADNRP